MLRENDGRGATGVGEVAGQCAPAPQSECEGFRQIRNTVAATLVLTGTILLSSNLPVEGAESIGRLKRTKTFASEVEYRKTAGKGFAYLSGGFLQFFDRAGKPGKKVAIPPGPDGQELNAITTPKGAVVIRMMHGNEWASASLDFYQTNGDKSVTLDAPSARFKVFPDGASALLPRGHGRTQYMDYDGRIDVVSSTGGILGTHRTSTSGSYPMVVFSPDGHLAAALVVGRLELDKSMVVILRSSGEEIGRLETSDWLPLSEDLSSRLPFRFLPIARVDPMNKVVAVSGQDLATMNRFVYGIGFDGRLLWRWAFKEKVPECGVTTIALPSKGRLIVSEHCRNRLSLSALNILTGSVVSQASFPLAAGKTTFSEGVASSGEDRFAFNITRQASDGTLSSSILLLRENLSAAWREDFPASASGEVVEINDGQVVLREAGKINVGNLAP